MTDVKRDPLKFAAVPWGNYLDMKQRAIEAEDALEALAKKEQQTRACLRDLLWAVEAWTYVELRDADLARIFGEIKRRYNNGTTVS